MLYGFTCATSHLYTAKLKKKEEAVESWMSYLLNPLGVQDNKGEKGLPFHWPCGSKRRGFHNS